VINYSTLHIISITVKGVTFAGYWSEFPDEKTFREWASLLIEGTGGPISTGDIQEAIENRTDDRKYARRNLMARGSDGGGERAGG
jgi:hypothetical protein